MTALTGQTPAATYKDLLQVSNSNAGIDATLRAIEDGEGTASLLQLSTTQVRLLCKLLLRVVANEDMDFTLSSRDTEVSFPVPTFRPVVANRVVAFDIMPNGAPSEFGANGYAWIDVCDTDCEGSEPALNTARIGARDTNIEIGSRAYNGATAKPVYLTVNGVTYIVLAAADKNIGLNGATAYGGGKGVVAIANANTVPDSNPSGGGVLYAEGGALKWRGSSGTVSTIAPA